MTDTREPADLPRGWTPKDDERIASLSTALDREKERRGTAERVVDEARREQDRLRAALDRAEKERDAAVAKLDDLLGHGAGEAFKTNIRRRFSEGVAYEKAPLASPERPSDERPAVDPDDVHIGAEDSGPESVTVWLSGSLTERTEQATRIFRCLTAGHSQPTPTCPTCGSDDTGVMWMHQSTGDGCDTESADPFHTLNMHHPDRRRD